ncbi:MAG: CYTH domain-containing protein [Planctomycetota bacterium]
MQNIEFKCELRDLHAARAQCRVLNATHVVTLTQTDTYFRVPDGRLKRRETPGEPVEWIFYQRPNRVTPKMSHFLIFSERQARARWGQVSLVEWLQVRKEREIWYLDNVRIHLDTVADLGQYLEFEALVTRRHHVGRCHEQIRDLRTAFQPVLGEVIAESYSDLLDQKLHLATQDAHHAEESAGEAEGDKKQAAAGGAFEDDRREPAADSEQHPDPEADGVIEEEPDEDDSAGRDPETGL